MLSTPVLALSVCIVSTSVYSLYMACKKEYNQPISALLCCNFIVTNSIYILAKIDLEELMGVSSSCSRPNLKSCAQSRGSQIPLHYARFICEDKKKGEKHSLYRFISVSCCHAVYTYLFSCVSVKNVYLSSRNCQRFLLSEPVCNIRIGSFSF